MGVVQHQWHLAVEWAVPVAVVVMVTLVFGFPVSDAVVAPEGILRMQHVGLMVALAIFCLAARSKFDN